MPGYEVVFKVNFPADSRLARVKTEESAERESTVDINGVTSERGTDVPFTGACCRSIAISESRLPTVVKEDACVCGEGVSTGTLSVVLETESCIWIPPESSSSCLVRRISTTAMAAAAIFS